MRGRFLGGDEDVRVDDDDDVGREEYFFMMFLVH
jgi:hypothetical protein